MRHGKPVKANSIAQGRFTSVLWMWMHAVSNFGSGMYCISKIAIELLLNWERFQLH